MNANFWHEIWEKQEIGFHEREGNKLIVEHLQALELKKDQRVFLPLCGKTRDIAWLLACGYRVVGVELSELAVTQLFEELKIKPAISTQDELSFYVAENLDIIVGDIFAVDASNLGVVDAVYDRAALVALPEKLREKYAAHLVTVTNTAPQLLITFDYRQQEMDGPPFSIDDQEVHKHYAQHYQIGQIASEPVAGKLKGKVDATEDVWLLKRNC